VEGPRLVPPRGREFELEVLHSGEYVEVVDLLSVSEPRFLGRDPRLFPGEDHGLIDDLPLHPEGENPDVRVHYGNHEVFFPELDEAAFDPEVDLLEPEGVVSFPPVPNELAQSNGDFLRPRVRAVVEHRVVLRVTQGKGRKEEPVGHPPAGLVGSEVEEGLPEFEAVLLRPLEGRGEIDGDSVLGSFVSREQAQAKEEHQENSSAHEVT